ncbi:MAG: hypothetical protein HKM93_15995 [Desulfobacteraceae bacterium]|nr:hypothetical protein [Desulfobacteraceae bacterium]
MAKIESFRIYNVARKKLPPGRLRLIYTRSIPQLKNEWCRDPDAVETCPQCGGAVAMEAPSERLFQQWAANPRHCAVTSRNPLDRIRLLVEELDLAGETEYARAAVDYIAEPLGGHFSMTGPEESDKGSVDGEIADIAVRLGRFTSKLREAMADGRIDSKELTGIRQHARQLISEIKQAMDACGIREGI